MSSPTALAGAHVEARMAEALAAHPVYLSESGRPIPEPDPDTGRVAA